MPVAGFTIKTDKTSTATITDVSTGAVSFNMDWGDGSISSAAVGSTLSHTYATKGSKTMTQTVYDAQGGTDAISRTAMVGLGTPSFSKSWDLSVPAIIITDTSQEPYDTVTVTVTPPLALGNPWQVNIPKGGSYSTALTPGGPYLVDFAINNVNGGDTASGWGFQSTRSKQPSLKPAATLRRRSVSRTPVTRGSNLSVI